MSANNPLLALQDALAALLEEKAELENKIGAVRNAIKMVQPIYETPDMLPDVAELGVTDIVRHILQLNVGERLTAPEIRDAVVSTGFSMDQYDNPLALIHQVLRRLIEAGQVSSIGSEDRKPSFTWIPREHPAAVYGKKEAERIARIKAQQGDRGRR